ISKAIINEYLEKIDAIASKLLNFELCHRHRIWSSRRPHSHCSSTVAACLSSGCFASIPWPLLFHFCLLCPIALSPSSRLTKSFFKKWLIWDLTEINWLNLYAKGSKMRWGW
ncbi:hypothetical protein HN873_015836, partial [Arachis hypogaea]